MFEAGAEKLNEIILKVMEFLFNNFIEPFTDIPTLKRLVFGYYKEDKMIWGTFYEKNLTEGFSPIYNTSLILSGFLLVSFIIFYGMRISSAPLNPQRRNELLEMVKDLLLVVIVLFNMTFIYDVLFSLNSSLVGIFSSAYESSIDELNESRREEISGILGWIFIQLIVIGLAIWANIYYLMRKVTLIILMGLGPIMIMLWMHPRTKGITANWFKELVSSIFIQSVHAFVFWTVATLSSTSTGFIETVILYLIFIPISESIRRLFFMGGDMQGGLAKAGSMLGMASLGAMYGSVKGAMNDKSVMGALKQGYDGAKSKMDGSNKENGNSLASNPGDTDGSTSRADRMLKAGQFTSKAGKAVAGVAGSLVGAPMGPMGAIVGASIGSETGGVVAGVAGRTGAAGVHLLGAAGQSLKDQHNKGLTALNHVKAKHNPDVEDLVAQQMAEDQTTSWASANRDTVKAGLRERFPDASDKEIDDKVDAIQEQKRAGFYKDAKAGFHSMNNSLINHPSPFKTSANEMATAWEREPSNRQAFDDEFAKQRPQGENESDSAYKERKNQAFKEQAAGMRTKFESVAQQAQQNLVNKYGNQGFSPKEYSNEINNEMDKQMPGFTGKKDALLVSDRAINQTMTEAQKGIVGRSGIPTQKMAEQIAEARTAQAGQAFVAEKVSQGMPKAEAYNQWKQQKEDVRSGFLQQATKATDKVSNSMTALQMGATPKVKAAAEQAVAYLTGASGAATTVAGLKQMPSIMEGAKNSLTQIPGKIEDAMVSIGSAKTLSFSEAGKTSFKHIKGAIQAGRELPSSLKEFGSNFKDQINNQVEADYGIHSQPQSAVQKHMQFANRSSYATGMVFGAGAYTASKNLANKFSPHKNQMQQEIYAPSEVMQMAQTIKDENGKQVIAPGAIRQVTTPNESFVEVRTKSGETKIVSKMGSGAPGMRKGDVIYQDLGVEDNSLVVRTPKGADTSTYRLDSGGGKVPTSLKIDSNPNQLLGDPRKGQIHSPVQRQQVPSYSQKVDSGQYYVEDIQAAGMSNIQMVVEKDRRFVTGQKDGVTYRVSPIQQGDTRLSGSQSVTVPMDIKNGTLTPIKPVSNHAAKVAVGAAPTVRNDLKETIQSQPAQNMSQAVEQITKVNRSQNSLGSIPSTTTNQVNNQAGKPSIQTVEHTTNVQPSSTRPQYVQSKVNHVSSAPQQSVVSKAEQIRIQQKGTLTEAMHERNVVDYNSTPSGNDVKYDYYSMKDVQDLIPSKQLERARKGVNRRQELDRFRKERG